MLKVLGFFNIRKRYFTIVFFLNCISAVLPTLGVYIIGKVLNDIYRIDYFLSFIFLLTSQNILKHIIRFYDFKLNLELSEKFSKSNLKFISEIPYHNYENKKFYEDLYLFSDIDVRIKDMFGSFMSILVYTVRFLGYVVIVSNILWYLGIIVFVLFIPIIFLSVRFGSIEYEGGVESSDFFRRASYLSSLFLDKESILEKRVFKYENFIDDKWSKTQNEGIKIEKKVLFLSELYANLGIVFTLIVLLVIFIVLFITGKSYISFGMYASLFSSLLVFTDDISYNLAMVIRKFTDSFLLVMRFKKFLSQNYKKKFGNAQVSFVESIEFRDVKFSYGKYKVLNGCNFKLERGKKYAIVGENGCGKTTLIKLLLGLINYEGSILINGVELSEISKKSIKNMFGVIFQDFNKYELSVLDNIALGENKSIDKVLNEVRLSEKVANLKFKENTVLGKLDDGISFSLGEWQKVALARILLRENQVLIFDEPTASLDAVSERKIIDNINKKVSDENLVIWITHRMNSCRSCDSILVIKDGVIFENGSFEELTSSDTYFNKLYSTQRSLYYE
ncbi:MAG: ABC transporter ATP-binding protein [Parvimonas sp.]|uniref:ABC transporter ATP-binding protein n=1 Tax=Parvimonas sp. TaxID=1944660 RepID=UPI002A75476D|nr:ABC transporter ATP-binding protein [Parvimonas sp.]MDY3051504.1 ABC transporter ATP-binding protein [Parvimonas sp.]